MSQEDVKEVIFQEYFEHVLSQVFPLLVTFLQLQVISYSLYTLDGYDGNGH